MCMIRSRAQQLNISLIDKQDKECTVKIKALADTRLRLIDDASRTVVPGPATSILGLARSVAFAWICALPHEMTAASSALDITHDKLPQSTTDHNTYLLGEVCGHKVVVTCLPAGVYGTTAAASAVSQLRSAFPAIRFGLLVGVGGGVPTRENDIRLGDIVVSIPTQTLSGVIPYDIGKATAGGGFERLGALNRPPDVTLTAVAQLRAAYLAGNGHISRIISDILCKTPYLRRTHSRPGPEKDQLFDATYEHSSFDDSTCARCDRGRLVARTPRPSDDPQVHYGLIASGNLVIKDGCTRDRLARSLGNICFEMEAAGVVNIIPTLVIRGICDYSDSHKNNTWQAYAALAAVAYAKELLSCR
ncbi:nucleoside phosphorylase domain-containing protein [Aspergillus granulosus]|uniref:Nucleoside phosphorylase domain-containing protein n=1 Tax=Aspergillus granulosus TaxID=176169 RepID=A0ABR4H4X0_9EURO